MLLVPSPLGIVYLRENDIERFLSYLRVFPVAGSEIELPERHCCEGIGEDVIGFHQRITLAIEREVPVIVAVVAELF